MGVGTEDRCEVYVGAFSDEKKVDHKIFIIQQKCNNTANIFVPGYIVVGDALTMGCAAENKNLWILYQTRHAVDVINIQWHSYSSMFIATQIE